ncbi:hypothetical protein B0J13DRAFT_259789 [Dactylonectria estremocensis]|uniref:Hydrophobin n=1 Tax=Dactylonectria estremocensis TaxID=1079267 RepID=A0A9P9F4T3_9HYPO|nr:hypothetical protein B0J13DRAFT_259789 [Dactylonectria estremocensis]
MGSKWWRFIGLAGLLQMLPKMQMSLGVVFVMASSDKKQSEEVYLALRLRKETPRIANERDGSGGGQRPSALVGYKAADKSPPSSSLSQTCELTYNTECQTEQTGTDSCLDAGCCVDPHTSLTTSRQYGRNPWVH